MFPSSSNMDLLVIILAVPLALMRLLGGLWLWQKMAEMPIWEQIRKWVKIVGLCGTPTVFAIVIFLVWMMKTKPPEFFHQFISPINILSWLLYFHMLVYDASILLPEPEEMKAPHGNEKSTLKFYIKRDLLKKELFACIIAIAPAVALLLFSSIDIQVFGMWVAGVVAFATGFLFWEHLKETGILTAPFKRQLAILSLLTTVAIGYISGYGVYVGSSGRESRINPDFAGELHVVHRVPGVVHASIMRCGLPRNKEIPRSPMFILTPQVSGNPAEGVRI